MAAIFYCDWFNPDFFFTNRVKKLHILFCAQFNPGKPISTRSKTVEQLVQAAKWGSAMVWPITT